MGIISKNPLVFHCIIHQKTLCFKTSSFGMNNFLDVLVSTVTVNAAVLMTVISNIFGRDSDQSMKISTARE